MGSDVGMPAVTQAVGPSLSGLTGPVRLGQGPTDSDSSRLGFEMASDFISLSLLLLRMVLVVVSASRPRSLWNSLCYHRQRPVFGTVGLGSCSRGSSNYSNTLDYPS